VDLVRVLHNALEIAGPMMEARQHTLTVDLPQHPVYTQADATRLGQVFANLLNNAAKYTADGGRIALAMKVDDGQVWVSVRDSGIGIAAERQGDVFEMFVQVDESLDRGRAGLGVGLSLARRLARLHGGDIILRSDGLGQGSEFIVQLPLAEPGKAGEPEKPEELAQAGSGPSLRVLVADDNVDFATSLASILESLGHEVTVVHDGVQALEAAQQRIPDLVFLDIGMPGFNGHELALRLRQIPATSQALLVAVTGWSQAQDRRRSLASGISHHMAKPVELSQLMPILAECQARHPAAPQVA
jgi:CheY-like chemotaxis protein